MPPLRHGAGEQSVSSTFSATSVSASVGGMPMEVGGCSSTVERTGEWKVGVSLRRGGGGGEGISVLVAPVLPDFFLCLGSLPTGRGTVETDLE